MPLWNHLLNGWILWLSKGLSRYLSNVLPDSRPNPTSLTPYAVLLVFHKEFSSLLLPPYCDREVCNLVSKIPVILVQINHAELSYVCDKLRSIVAKTLKSALSQTVHDRNPPTLCVPAESQGDCSELRGQKLFLREAILSSIAFGWYCVWYKLLQQDSEVASPLQHFYISGWKIQFCSFLMCLTQ